MFYWLSKIDLVKVVDGLRIGVQTDHRTAAEIESDWDRSVVFAASRARGVQLSGRVAGVTFHFSHEPPGRMVTLVRQLGCGLDVAGGGSSLPCPPDDDAVDSAVADAFQRLGTATFAEHGLPSTLDGLARLEATLRAGLDRIGPDSNDEEARWTAVIRLGGAAAVVMNSSYGGRLAAETGSGCVPPFHWELDGGGRLNLFGRAATFLKDDPGVSPSRLISLLGEQSQGGAVMFHFQKPDWLGLPNALTVTLPGLEGPHIEAPAVATLIVDHPTSIESLPKTTSLEEAERFRQQAIANNRKLDVEIQALDVGCEAPLILVHGHYYAAERLLDAEFMRGLHRQVDSDLLLAAVPATGRLFVQSAHIGFDLVGAFQHVVPGQYEQAAPSDKLSPVVMLVEDGEIVGRVPESA